MKLTNNQREFIRGLLFLALLVLVIACSAHRQIPPTIEETMLAWVGDMPVDQGQWNQYQMEERQREYQRENEERQREEYIEQIERRHPRGYYGHAGKPLDLGF